MPKTKATRPKTPTKLPSAESSSPATPRPIERKKLISAVKASGAKISESLLKKMSVERLKKVLRDSPLAPPSEPAPGLSPPLPEAGGEELGRLVVSTRKRREEAARKEREAVEKLAAEIETAIPELTPRAKKRAARAATAKPSAVPAAKPIGKMSVDDVKKELLARGVKEINILEVLTRSKAAGGGLLGIRRMLRDFDAAYPGAKLPAKPKAVPKKPKVPAPAPPPPPAEFAIVPSPDAGTAHLRTDLSAAGGRDAYAKALKKIEGRKLQEKLGPLVDFVDRLRQAR